MDWRREDAAYGAGALGAAVLIGYLVAGNFGLVPSPLKAARASDLPPPEVPALAAAATPLPLPLAPPPPAVRRAPSPPPRPRAPAPDRTPPRVGITTSTGLQVSLTEPGFVRGTASDDVAVAGVVVSFSSSSGTLAGQAVLECPTPATCTWAARIPAAVGTYTVRAEAADRAGNVGRSLAIQVSVVNTGGTVQSVGNALSNVVQSLPSAVGGLLRGLVALL